MAKPSVFIWPPADIDAICLSQTATSLQTPRNLIINGPLSSQGKVVFNNISRSVSLTSASNLSGTTFTITGTYKNKLLSVNITGPNNNTVTTTQFFDTVTNVSVNSSLLNPVSVGSGNIGQTFWSKYNYYSTIAKLSVQSTITGTAGTITYKFQSTLDDVENNDKPNCVDGIIVPDATGTQAFTIIMNDTATNFNTTLLGAINDSLNYYNVAITAQSADFNGELIVTTLQQGIN